MKLFEPLALALLLGFFHFAFTSLFSNLDNDQVESLLAQSMVDTCACGDSLFASGVMVLPDSLRSIRAIEDALDEGQITFPDSLISIPTWVLDCTASISVDINSLEELFGENLFADCVTDKEIVDLGFYSYVWHADNVWGQHWEFYQCTPSSICLAWEDRHALQITLQDSCGVQSSALVFFEVKDTMPPIAKCQDVVSVTMKADSNIQFGKYGISRITADLIDDGSWDNCGLSSVKIRRPIIYPDIRERLSILAQDSLDGDAMYTSWSDTTYFFCDDGELNFAELQLVDQAGNTSICASLIEIANLYYCDSPGSISSIFGDIRTTNGAELPNVQVDLTGSIKMRFVTKDDGFFNFNSIIMGGDYIIQSSKDDDPFNGLSTLDLILIRKHILGQTLLDSPYKMIAADVNNSGSISVIDIIQLQKMILKVDTKLEDNSSWRFIDANYVFPNPNNPWQESFPEMVEFKNISLPTNEASFTAIKIGDVNVSAIVGQ